MSLSLYLGARLGEALGIGLPGIVVPILLRKRPLASIVGGAIGLSVLPAIAVYGGYVRGSQADQAIVIALAAMWGLVLGGAIHALHRMRRRKSL